MAEKKEKPLTREDVLRLIEENGGTAKGLDLSGKRFEAGINLRGLNLKGIILNRAFFPTRDEIHDFRISMQPAQLQGANLMQAQLQKADLALAQLQGANLMAAELQEAHLLSANLQGALLRMAQLQGAYLSHAQLQGAELYRTRLEGASLHQVKLSPDTELEDADWGSYILGEEKSGLFDWAVSTYRQLKVWYKNAGISDIEGEFLYREMKCKRKQFWWGTRRPRLKDLIRPFKPKELLRAIIPRKPHWWTLLTIYELLCGYGEKLKRIILWVFLIIFGLAAAYYFWGSFTSSSFWDTLYYSAASFTALGYGQWAPQPTGWAKGMGAAEAIIGVFLIALFLVTFTRKMTR